MTENAVLILMPVLNEGKNIDRLISIIRAQTHRNFLLIIQDNLSEDDTLAIARHHEIQDNRIQVFSNPFRVSGGENWFSMISKVRDLDEFDYCCFQAGDDYWGDKDYLSNLVKLLDTNPNLGAANPIFEIVNPINKVLKSIESGVSSKFALVRVWKLCTDWDHVHHIYGLYRKNVFEYLMTSKVSRFTNYSGSDWWWTYEFLVNHRSIACKNSIYLKLLGEPEKPPITPFKQGLRLSYSQTILNTCMPELLHIARARQIRHKFYLVVIPLFFFTGVAFKKLWKLHYGIIRRRFIGKEGT